MRIRYWDSSVLSESGKLFSMQWQHKRTNILGRLSAETGTYRWCYTGVDRADGQSNDVVSRRVCYPRLTARFRQQHARVRAEMLSGTRCLVKRSSLGAALSVAPCSSVRSVTALCFHSPLWCYKNNYGSKFEIQTLKVKVTGNENVKLFIINIFIKCRSLTSNKNDHRSILHISSNTFHQKMFRFCDNL